MKEGRNWENLGSGIMYSDDIDPEPIRKLLGLDGNAADTTISKIERKRLAEILQRTGNLSQQDLIILGAGLRLKPLQVARQRGSNRPDPVPGAPNQHLQR